MKVQRIRFPEREHTTWLVLDDEYRPVQPILVYLKFLDDLGRSPNTIRAAALHLKTFWEFLGQERVDWTEVDVAHLATFIQWLRRPDSPAMSIEPRPPRRTNATIDLMLTSVHGLYEYHQRLHTIPDLPLYRFVMMPQRRYKPLLHGIAKTKPVQTRIVSIKREQRRPKTLTSKQVQHLLDACVHTRDRFLLALLFSTGIRIGQALGLRHEDVSVEDGTIRIVPREDNPNGARAKTPPCTIAHEVVHRLSHQRTGSIRGRGPSRLRVCESLGRQLRSAHDLRYRTVIGETFIQADTGPVYTPYAPPHESHDLAQR